MRAMGRVLAAASMAALAALGFAGSAAADCSGPPVSIADAIATAQEIVIGDVVAVRPGNDNGTGKSRSFVVQVTHTVRGRVVPSINIDNMPTGSCSGDLVAAVGDRVALALSAHVTSDVQVNGIAWIVGQPADGFETTTIEEVYKLAGVPMPVFDTAPAPDPPIWVGPAALGLTVGLVFVIVGVIGRRVGATP
jgi:hypothetical protein